MIKSSTVAPLRLETVEDGFRVVVASCLCCTIHISPEVRFPNSRAVKISFLGVEDGPSYYTVADAAAFLESIWLDPTPLLDLAREKGWEPPTEESTNVERPARAPADGDGCINITLTIPANRTETTNAERAARARVAIEIYGHSDYYPNNNENLANVIGDLIADLLHLANLTGQNPDAVWRRAWVAYENEVIEEMKGEGQEND